MPVRKREDVSALELYGARAWWLEVIEGQYEPLDVDRVTEAIGHALDELEPTVVAVPLGIGHLDHIAVASACWELSRARPALSWIVYAEHPYLVQWPKLLDERLATLAACADIGPMEVDRPDPRRKRAAMERYRTQVRALRQSVAAALAEERHWQFTPKAVALP